MDALNRAIAFFGTKSEMAKQLGYGSGSMVIRQWEVRKSVPPQKAILIERLTDGAVTKAELCPEIFGDDAA